MAHNLKALCSALVAILALGAMGGSAASADTFRNESRPVQMIGEQDPGTVYAIGTTSSTIKCNTETATGTMSGESETALELAPEFSECSAGAVPTTFERMGCVFDYTLDPAPATTGTAHIVCPTTAGGVTDEMTLKIGAPGTLKCLIDIPEQTIGGIKYTNVGAGKTREITVDYTTMGLTYKETAGTGIGACSTSMLQNTGTFTGKDTITGQNNAGTEHIGIFVQ